MSQRDSSKITIIDVAGDHIQVQVVGLGPNPIFGLCNRRPANGLFVFDFQNNNGVLTRIHVGHAVTDLSMGTPGAFTTDDIGRYGTGNRWVSALCKSL